MATRYLLLISDGPIDVDPLDVDAPAGCRVYAGAIGPDVPADDSHQLGNVAVGLELGLDLPMPDDVIPARERGARGLIAAMLAGVDPEDDDDSVLEPTDAEDGGAGEPNAARVTIDRAAWESRRFVKPADPGACEACGREAVTLYPDDSGIPSCGSVACELRMQAAEDYHADHS